MFKVKDECAMPTPYDDKCAAGITECVGKKCVKYALPKHLKERYARLGQLQRMEADYLALAAKIAELKSDLKLEDGMTDDDKKAFGIPVDTEEAIVKEEPREAPKDSKRGRPRNA